MADYLPHNCIRVLGGDVSKGDWLYDGGILSHKSDLAFCIGKELKSITIQTEREIGSRTGALAGQIAFGTAGAFLGMAADKEKYVCAMVEMLENRKFLALMHQEMYQLLLAITIEPDRAPYERKWNAIQEEQRKIAEESECAALAMASLSKTDQAAYEKEVACGLSLVFFVIIELVVLLIGAQLVLHKCWNESHYVFGAFVIFLVIWGIPSAISWNKLAKANKLVHKRLKKARATARKTIQQKKLLAEAAINTSLSVPVKPEPETDTDTKSCPYCAEKIMKAAIFCRYCHKDLPN